MRLPCVLVVDAGLGNIGSVVTALQRHDCAIQRLPQPPSPEATDAFTHAVLPGVGAFAAGMEALKASGWEAWIKQMWCQTDRPLLGICLGMQLLASEGVEGAPDGGAVAGLDLIPGRVERLSVASDLVLPHVGWNALHWHSPASPLAQGLPEGGDMYFVHSYAFQPSDPAHGLAASDYGGIFTAVVCRGACYGVQFHPEKSQRLGRRLLENFLALPPC
ncbi:MAG: imidazole glycerol phosphate synthase subunit HisH [Vulcanococcus sp.]|uniref:imidazole glycerol phosphate synthase subunit HisH n=1 Tax=Vulcanococcus sp. TaxID=2856995 RepID=UPI0025E204C9|nr:imidazole glycerol phosphate synthase subunit HisH [Vulcanococcus sp.]MBW0167197.1 imidazole glycerol phosphate synthase subunit HisH [Vulcanococcus sp.]